MTPVSRGFRRRRGPDADAARIPPGQHLVDDFPVLTFGPTPRTDLATWTFEVTGAVEHPRRWTWDALRALATETVTADIHCVTSWSKLDTVWEGVAVDTLLDGAGVRGGFVVAFCDGGYETNLPLADVTGGRAWVAFEYDGRPLEPQHGGPARLLVPHLYLWKSAKWVRGLRVVERDTPGFWEQHGYHRRGDPWLEQRYWGD